MQRPRQLRAGFSYGKSVEDYDPRQLAKGIKVEMEHTDDPAIALAIAMDHLEEIENYYDLLEEMEKSPRAKRRIRK